ncbi:MAG: aminotransferase class V-fold PLP-dependent enzyme [Chlamydiales bacterium]
MKKIHFDSHVSAAASKTVLEKMIPFLGVRKIAPSILKEAYQAIYDLVGAKAENHFIFTSSGAEAVNHAVFAAYLDIARKTGKNHFITSNVDEAPAIMAMGRLQEMGCVYEMAQAEKEGRVTLGSIADAITPRTAMLSLSWANGLTGVVQPVYEIAELCRDRGILFHVEATHVLGKEGYTLESSGADILTFNGEELHAPRRTGGLFIRSGIEISPMIMGGEEQGGMLGGSIDGAGLIGLAQACKEILASSDALAIEGARLRNRFETLVGEGTALFKQSERLPNITAMIFPPVVSETLLYRLNVRGVFATAGGGHFQQIRHILKASGIEAPFCHSGLSFAFSQDTTEKEIERGAAIINEEVIKLKNYSEGLLHEY